MNLTLLKNYAPAARKAFMEAVTRRAGVVGIHSDRVEPVTESGDVALIGGQPFPRSIVPLRKQLLEIIQRDGFAATMEAMAYTWFNRLVAIRFMELHDGWLSHGYRVLSHPDGHSLPEIIQHAEHLDLKSLDREEVIRLKLAGNRDEELYRILLLAQCAELNRILPDVFSRLDDATILLLPDNLLHSDSLIRHLVANSSEEDWKEVEVLGWLYQFYISEKKEKAMDDVKKQKRGYRRDELPAVTQLFTPHWIVRYLVENSLGRLWLLNRPNSRLCEHMPYYIEGEAETDFLKINKPEDIKLVDPAVGSGHMLTYAFDLLTLIYEEEGYAPSEIPALILRYNLHGLEICPRAAQLAELALVFKAREKSRRFFLPDHLVSPNITELKDIRFDDGEVQAYFNALGCQPSALHPQLTKLLHQFEESKNLGSLIQPCLSEVEIQSVRSAIQNSTSYIQNSDLMVGATHLKVLRVLEQGEALTQRYHAVVANPPYLDLGAMNAMLKSFVEASYESTKQNTDASFIQASRKIALKNGFIALITQRSWMFLSRLEDFRSEFLSNDCLVNMLYLGPRTFPEINGEKVQNTAFVSRTGSGTSIATFYRLDKLGSANKETAFLKRQHGYHRDVAELKGISGFPIAFWASAKLVATFRNGTPLKETADIRVGLDTGDNPRFLRLWWEASIGKIEFGAKNSDDFHRLKRKWAPHTKGGEFRKWFGNLAEVIAYSIQDYQVLSQQGNKLPSRDFYFRPGMTYTRVSADGFSVRMAPLGCIFNSAAPTVFPTGDTGDLIFGILNSSVVDAILECLSPTLNYQAGELRKIPIPHDSNLQKAVSPIVHSSVALARADWDNFETSWDFRDQPLLRPGMKDMTLESSWKNWETQCTTAIHRMQELETENNRLFIAAYGLDGELQPEVPEEQITLARADQRKDIAAFLSYALGCMMGRYSLDEPGLTLANAGDTLENYLTKVGKSKNQLAFVPDADGIIPVLDGEWFDDDIVARTKEFLRVTFGESTLEENLRFIEKALGKDLRDYFLTDFYKDHLQTYKNRPIYWLFSSGKQRAFQCLVYLHRYQEGTLARIRTEYVIPLQGKLSALITRLGGEPEQKGEGGEIAAATTSSARKKLQNELDKAKKQMVELLAYDEQLRSYADQRIALDLDDGVKVNYTKFGPLVAEAKKICGTKED